MKLLFIDTETTGRPGLDPDPRIVQLGAVLTHVDASRQAQLDLLIQPDGWTIPDVCRAIHGIGTERCQAFGVRMATALGLLGELIAAADLVIAAADLVIAHNLPFDQAMLNLEQRRANPGAADILGGRGLFCTMDAMTPVCKLTNYYGDYKWPKLDEAYFHFFSQRPAQSHSALADVESCMAIFFEMRRRGLIPHLGELCGQSEPAFKIESAEEDNPF